MGEKDRALEKAREELEKQGINVVNSSKIAPPETMSTGIPALDTVIRKENGGWPRGRIVELFGPESGGKSTLSLISISDLQSKGGVAAYVDAENSFDPTWAKRLGVDVDKLQFVQIDTGEEGLTAAEVFARSHAVDLIIIDSTAALTPKAVIEGSMEDQHMGIQARMISQGLQKLNNVVAQSKCTVIFINQLRDKIGSMWGDPETTPGGRALKFYASLRIRIGRVKSDIDKTTGHRLHAIIKKNKIAPPFGDCEFDIYYDRGVDHGGSLFDTAVSMGIINKDGRTYTYEDVRIVGQDKMKEHISGNKELQDKLFMAVRQSSSSKGD